MVMSESESEYEYDNETGDEDEEDGEGDDRMYWESSMPSNSDNPNAAPSMNFKGMFDLIDVFCWLVSV
jgi:hypothetical protein